MTGKRRSRKTFDHQPYLTVEELRTALAACDARDRALFAAMVELAMRAGEPGLLRRTDWRDGRHEVYVRRLKGSKNGTLACSDELDRALRAWEAERPASAWLFPGRDRAGPRGLGRDTVRELWEQAATRAGLSPRARYVHILKHTRGTLLSAAGVKREAIGEAMGHAMLTSTDRYLKVTPEDRDRLHRVSAAIAAKVLA